MAASPPPSHLNPSYAREYNGDTLRDVAITFTVLEIVFVSLRYLSFYISRKPAGIDDWLIAPGLLLCIGNNISSLAAIHFGKVGYHLDVVEELYPWALVPWAKTLYVTPMIYSAAVCVPKIAILILYHRVFENRTFRIVNYVSITVVISIAIADILVGAFVCTPVKKMWDTTLPGTCVNIPIFYRYGTLPNAISDLFILIQPLPMVWRLHMPIARRIGLTITFLAGSVGLVTSICRTVAFFTHNPLIDGTWESVIFLMWSNIEPGCYLIAACLLSFRPLINLLTGGRFDPDHSADLKWKFSQGSFSLRRLVPWKSNSGVAEEGNQPYTRTGSDADTNYGRDNRPGEIARKTTIDVYSTRRDLATSTNQSDADDDLARASPFGESRMFAV